MAYTRAAAALTIGPPHYDGYPTSVGIGRDWMAVEPRDDTIRGFTPDVGGQYGWWYAGRFEYVDKLGCIAPIGTYTESAMSLGSWQVISGKWRESSAGSALRRAWLHYYDGRAGRYAAGAHGEVRSNASIAPAFVCNLWRMPGAVDETEPAIVDLHLYNDGGTQYILRFPAQGTAGVEQTGLTGETSPEYDSPLLLGKPAADANWSVVDRMSLGSTPRLGNAGDAPLRQTVRVEYLDGVLLVRLNEWDQLWAFSGKWDSSVGTETTFSLASSMQVGVRVIGHTAMFQLFSLTYPSSAVLRPVGRFVVGSKMAQVPSYKLISSQPAGTSITVSAVTTGNPAGTYPQCTFVSSGSSRPALYNVQEYRPGTTGNADTSTVTTTGNNDFVLVSLSGRISDNWRGSTISATYRSKTPGSIEEVRPNSKLTATVDLTDGASAATTMFVGYTIPPRKRRVAGPVWVEGTLDAADYIDARLSRKCMSWHCSYENWTMADAFRQILSQAGVPDALVSVNPACEGIYLPSASMRGERRWSFAPDTDVVSALDTLVASVGLASTAYSAPEKRGMTWGVNQAGLVRLAPAYEHVAGKYLLGASVRSATSDGWVIDDDDIDPEDFVVDFETARDLEGYANMLQMISGQGVDADSRIVYDEDSWETPANSRFIGDIWQQFEGVPDGGDMDAIIYPRWRDLSTRNWLISFTMHDRPAILPEDELLLQVSHVDIPNNSIARVLSKEWSIDEAGLYTQRIEAAIVEFGT